MNSPPSFAAGACGLALLFALSLPVGAQEAEGEGAVLTGRVIEAETGAPVAVASISIEESDVQAISDSLGRYRIAGVPPGPRMLVVQRIGYATARIAITVPASGVLRRDVELSVSALAMPDLNVTGDAIGRARGELGTASVIDQKAIEVQSATSLAGVLELVPGTVIEPPGLGGVQQVSLRAVPGSFITGVTQGGPSAAEISSFGTLIIVDGVPLSNNANLQTTGPRGEFSPPTSAGGGVDLRRIPAATLERVEVIRGIPSARYGDLTQGAVVVETRAGAFQPESRALLDPHTAGGTMLGGWNLGGRQALSGNLDFTSTRLEPGFSEDRAYRLSGQFAHSAYLGGTPSGGGERSTLDSRLDVYQIYEERPEDPDIAPGVWSSNRDRGFRLLERLRHPLSDDTRLEVTASAGHTQQRSQAQALRSRGAMPITDRLEEGRAFGRYVGGEYPALFGLDGDVWQIYSRGEVTRPATWFGADHRLLGGLELRREWNSGAGYRFDIEFPPQVSFNGVQGFDRPRPFDEIPPLVTSAFYVDDRMLSILPGDVALEVQAGLRVDLLHEGSFWVSGIRDAVPQPRLNVQIAPLRWLRLRAGAGRTAKVPTLGNLHPAPQYFDVVNVNWFANDPAERLAVLTTFIRDPSNPDLGFSRGRKLEAGVEVSHDASDASISLVAFSDRTDGGIGFRSDPGFLQRERYALSDSTSGTGRPPELIEPPIGADTVPILLDVPANNLDLDTRGVELTARLPEIRPLRTRVEVQGAWIDTKLFKEGLDFGLGFSEFQLNENRSRAPFWEAVTRTGVRGLVTSRIIHHRPELGVVISGTIQHIFREETRNIAGTDTLAFSGYITRSGELVRVAPEDRLRAEFEDLRQRRINTPTGRSRVAPDWLMSLQVSLDVPLGGRLSFYAFNALDRPGTQGEEGFSSRFFPALRFGIEGSLPVADALARAFSSD